MAVGDAEDILEMIWSYIPHGISKFILRPLGDGDEEMMAQSRRLIDEVLPPHAKVFTERHKLAS